MTTFRSHFSAYLNALGGAALMTTVCLSALSHNIAWGASMPFPDPTPSVIAAHGCWTGPAPRDMAGKMPGHVVVTYATESSSARRPVYSHHLVGKALSVALEGKPAAFQVAAFCR